MADCVNNSEILTDAQKPLGYGGPVETGRPSSNPVTEPRNWEARQGYERQRHAEWGDAVTRAIDGDATQGSTGLGSGDRTAINSAARKLRSQIDLAWEREGLREREFQAAMDKHFQPNVGQQSLMLTLTNKISKAFSNKAADLFDYFALNWGEKGRHAADNSAWAAFNSIEPLVQGAEAIYKQPMTTLQRKILPLADRLSTDPTNVMLAIGDWLVGDHMPSRNAMALSRWRAELLVERAKPIDKQNQRAITERETWIAELEAMQDIVRPDDGEGNFLDPATGKLSHLRSGGMTNAEAAKQKADILQQLGISEAEMRAYAQEMKTVNDLITRDRIDKGLVRPEVVENFPGGEFADTYVPIKTKIDNTTGPVNNSNIYNPGKYFAIDGTYLRPDSAYVSIMHHGRRAAYEIGLKDFSTQMAAMYESQIRSKRDTGITREPLDVVYKALRSSNEGRRIWAERLKDQGGVVHDTPVFDAEGNRTGSRKYLYFFDPAWKDTRSGKTGADLNKALSGTVEVMSGFKPMATATSWYGQLLARWNPPLAVVNGLMRDPFERISNMAGRDYYDATGNLIRGSSVIGNYIMNYPRAQKMVFDAMTGRASPESTAGQYWSEYMSQGLKQEYLTGRETPRTLADALAKAESRQKGWTEKILSDPKMAEVKKQLDALGAGKDRAIEAIDNWNAYFNNLAPFAQYLTLREAGMDVRGAGRATLEMFNLNTQGTLQPLLSTLFPFVKPTIQTGAALARTFGLAPNAQGKFQPNMRGYMGMAAAYMAYSALYPLAKESLGIDPETGKYRIDQLGVSELGRFLPLGVGNDGDYFKLHLGFGGPGVVATLYIGMDRMQRGLMSPQEVVFETLYSAGKNVLPGNWPEFSVKANPIEWFKHALAPTILKPMVANVDFRGRPITMARPDANKPMSSQGYLSTEKGFHQIAKGIYSSWGIDLAPEQVKNLYNFMNVGPIRLIHAALASTEVLDMERKGSLRETAPQVMGPWLTAMGGSMFYGRTYENGRAMYWQTMDRMRQQVKSAGVDVTAPRGARLDSPEYAQSVTTGLKQAGFSDDFVHDWLLGKKIESQLHSNATRFSSEIRPIWLSSDESGPIKRKFMELANLDSQLYNQAIRQFRILEGR